MRRLLFIVGVVLVASCSGKNPTAPAPPPLPSVAGNWTGNLEMSNYAAEAVNVQFTQAGPNITGTWAATGPSWNGSVSGSVDHSTFTGLFTVSAPTLSGIGRCGGDASVSGPVSSGMTTIRWTSPGFTGSCTGMPVNLRWNLQRR